MNHVAGLTAINNNIYDSTRKLLNISNDLNNINNSINTNLFIQVSDTFVLNKSHIISVYKKNIDTKKCVYIYRKDLSEVRVCDSEDNKKYYDNIIKTFYNFNQ